MPIEFNFEEFTTEELEALDDALDIIEPLMIGKGTNLTMDDRKSLYKIKNTRYALLVRTMDYAANYPEFVPSYANYSKALRHYRFLMQLAPRIQRAKRIAEIFDDTAMATGSEGLRFVINFYNNVKMAKAQNVPGADSIFQDLNTFFDLPPRPEDDNEPEPETPEE